MKDNSQIKILVVDDTPFNIKIVSTILQEVGYNIYSTTSGREALEMVKNIRFNLILLDVMMPEMDGYEVIRKLKNDEDTRDIPIIFLTARGDSESVVRAFDEGAYDYLIKPFNPKELLSRVKTHIELKFARENLEETNKTKDKFLSIIGHDLKNPIGAINGFAMELKENIDSIDIDEIKYYTDRIFKNSNTVSNLLQNLLQWARSQNGKIEYNPKILNLYSIVENSVTLYMLNANAKKIEVMVLVDENIEVYADFNMLDTVIRNFLSNAIKFTKNGGQIAIKAKEEDNFFRLIIRDTGVGIKEEDLNNLFAIDSNMSTKGTNQEEGTGLGLILCKEFVEKNGGEVFVESVYGEGSSFSFTIPKLEKR